MTRRSLANAPVSLRSLAWIAAAALLGSAVIEAGPTLSYPVLLIAGAAIMLALLIGPGRGLLRSRGDDAPVEGEDLQRRIEDLEAQALPATELEQRVAELENRLDFAERVLAQRDANPELPLHRTPV